MLPKKNRGSVLPIVLVAVILIQITFYGILRVYENQMETYLLLKNHYQSQTILSLSEDHLKVLPDKEYIHFNIGTVKVEVMDGDTTRLVSTLHSGYQETKTIAKD